MSDSSSTRSLVLREEIENLIDESLRQSFPKLSDLYGDFVTVTGDALEMYGDDYQCPNVMHICEKLREENPRLFWERGTKDIAQVIIKNLRKSEMIQQVSIRGGCFISFKLSWEWMAKRIQNMLDDGIHTWAPIYGIKSAMVEFPTPAKHSNMYADGIRSLYIRDTIARMFEYSGVDVRYRVSNMSFDDQSQREIEHKFSVDHAEFKKRVRGRTAPPPLFVWTKESRAEKREYDNVRIDLGSLWSGIHVYQADLILYITPARQRGYIEKCINVARDVKWVDSDIALCCGYVTSANEKEKLACLGDEFRNYSKVASLVELGKAIGYTYTPALVFECALRYTYLKKHRLVDCTFSLEDMLDGKGNTFVYLLTTLALVYSSMKNPRREMFKFKKSLVAKERDLGLHLVRFTDAVEDSCGMALPHLMCEYVCDLCKKFTSCYSEVPPVETRLLLCEATAVVMDKCFHLLHITPESFRDQQPRETFLSSQDVATLNYFTPWPFSVARPENPRFEMISMFVSLHDPAFEEGNMFGSIEVSDAYRLVPDEWSKSYKNDVGFVSYFERDWCNPMRIKNDSFRSFGNPNSRHAVAFSSSTDMYANLVVTSLEKGDRKDACYRLFKNKSEELKKLKEFWEEDKQVKCDYMTLKAVNGFIRIYYILMRDAIDVKMELRYVSPIADLEGIKVRGHVHAFYEGVLNVFDDFDKMPYKTTVFRTHGARILAGDTLELERSVLSVPANGCLMIEAFLQDVKSGEIIVDQTLPYPVIPEGSTPIEWNMPVCVRGKKGKRGTKDTFILTLNWSKGPGVIS